MKTIFTFFLIISISSLGISQVEIEIERQVIASSGGVHKDASTDISVSWTLGEVAINTLESANADIILTQGFHQPDDFTSATEEVIKSLGITIFPNPVDVTLKIQLDEFPSDEIKVNLTNLNGQIIQEKILNSTSLEFQMSDLPDAMYLIVFSYGKNTFTRKVLKASK